MDKAQAKRVEKTLNKNGISAKMWEGYVGRGPTQPTCAVSVEYSWSRQRAIETCSQLKGVACDGWGLGVVFY